MSNKQIERRLDWLKENRNTLADIAEIVELETLLDVDVKLCKHLNDGACKRDGLPCGGVCTGYEKIK